MMVTATLSKANGTAMKVPLTLEAGSAEAGDFGSLAAITIGAGMMAGTGMIPTSDDDDTEDETFMVMLAKMPQEMTKGDPSSVEVMIKDHTPTNQPPAFKAPSYAFELKENEDGRDRPVAVGTVAAADPDGDEMAYALAAGDGQLFAVGTRSGVVTYTGAGEDYESEPNRYVLTMEARDPQGAVAKAEVTIQVTDVNEVPSVTASCDPCEVGPGNEVLLIAEATDPDGDQLTCRWSAPEGRIVEGTLEAEARWRAPADTGPVEIVVRVSDGRGGTASAVVDVMVVNAPPAFDAPSYAFELSENEDGRDRPVALGRLVATDPDGDEVAYALVAGDGRRFAVGTRDGAVAYTGAGEDYEAEPNRYALTIQARDPHGAEAMAEVTIEVTNMNEGPSVSAVISGQSLAEGGAAARLDLGPYFVDPDGDPLNYAAVSSDTSVAAVAVAGSALTLTPATYGSAMIEVTARDPGGLFAKQTFAAVVDDRPVRVVLDETLAASARAHLASARMTLGRKLAQGRASTGSMLTVLGYRVPLSRAAAREAAGRLLYDAAIPGGLAFGAGNTEFVFGWGDGSGGVAGGIGGSENEAAGRQAWRLWGQGDIQTFSGATSAVRRYEGDLRTIWVGFDHGIGERWLTGIAVARSMGGGDWHAGTAGGRLETSLTAVYPYLRWADAATSAWAMAGGGRGTAENVRASGRVGESDLELGLGLFEVRRRFAGWFGLRADAGWARLATGDGGETVDGRGAVSDQQRLGIELSPSSRHLGLALDASVRHDGGAGQTGTGLELAGGLRFASGPVRIDTQGRILATHSAQDYSERGLGVTLTVGNPSASGMLLTVSSHWGGPAAATGALWEARLHELRRHVPDASWSLDAQIRWVPRFPGME